MRVNWSHTDRILNWDSNYEFPCNFWAPFPVLLWVDYSGSVILIYPSVSWESVSPKASNKVWGFKSVFYCDSGYATDRKSHTSRKTCRCIHWTLHFFTPVLHVLLPDILQHSKMLLLKLRSERTGKWRMMWFDSILYVKATPFFA